VATAGRAAARRGEDELIDQIGHLIELLEAWPGREQLLVPERDPRAVLAWAARWRASSACHISLGATCWLAGGKTAPC